jgi:hypothetical protein
MKMTLTLLEHSPNSKRVACKAFAKLVPVLAAEFNKVLAKHGVKDLEIHSFSFGKKPGLATVEAPRLVQGVGVTKDGVWVASKYEK